jgi:3-oxoacyl-[acyl-carrier-protein] synthase-3
MTSAVQDALHSANLDVDDIDVVVAHQANLRIIQGTAKHLGLGEGKALISVQKYGNTSSASIPVTMSEGYREGRFSEGDIVVLCAFGGGLSWGSVVLEYSRTGMSPAMERAPGPLTTTAESRS